MKEYKDIYSNGHHSDGYSDEYDIKWKYKLYHFDKNGKNNNRYSIPIAIPIDLDYDSAMKIYDKNKAHMQTIKNSKFWLNRLCINKYSFKSYLSANPDKPNKIPYITSILNCVIPNVLIDMIIDYVFDVDVISYCLQMSVNGVLYFVIHYISSSIVILHFERPEIGEKFLHCADNPLLLFYKKGVLNIKSSFLFCDTCDADLYGNEGYLAYDVTENEIAHLKHTLTEFEKHIRPNISVLYFTAYIAIFINKKSPILRMISEQMTSELIKIDKNNLIDLPFKTFFDGYREKFTKYCQKYIDKYIVIFNYDEYCLANFDREELYRFIAEFNNLSRFDILFDKVKYAAV